MSSVRMCDKCQTVFSERDEGWQTFTGTTMRKRNGRREPVSETLDMCPACAIGGIMEEDEQTALESRIAKLEKETGMNKETGTFENAAS